MSQSIRYKWCEKEISDLDYIRHLESENAKLKEHNTCETCKHKNECEINESSVHCLSWKFNRQCEDSEFGCFYHEPKEQQ